MSTNQAAKRAVQVYNMALRRTNDSAEAYVRGLDFLIDIIYHDDKIGKVTMRAIRIYERTISA